ncbi:MAG: hypothetical protein Tsb0020_24840 [Haliangiales bacterium]
MDAVRTWLPRSFALAALALYLAIAPVGLSLPSAVEAATLATTLGVPAPLAAALSPLVAMLGKAAALLPLGPLPYRLALVSAICAGLAVLWTMRLCLLLAPESDRHALVGAATTGALLALSAVFVRQATMLSVAAPMVALMAGGLLLIGRVAGGGDARWGLGLALVCGLGLATGAQFWLVAGPALALCGVRFYRGARWPLLAPLVMIGAAVSAYGYVPVRAQALSSDTAADTAPVTLSALTQHLDAGPAPTLSPTLTVDVGTLGDRVELVADHLGPFAPLAALFGLVVLLRQRRHRWLGAALLVLGAGDAIGVLWLYPEQLIAWRAGAPLALAVALWAGLGIAALSRWMQLAGPFVAAVAALIMVAPVALVSLSAVAKGAERAAAGTGRALAEEALEGAPSRISDAPGAQLLAPLVRYLRAVEGARPDLDESGTPSSADHETTPDP